AVDGVDGVVDGRVHYGEVARGDGGRRVVLLDRLEGGLVPEQDRVVAIRRGGVGERQEQHGRVHGSGPRGKVDERGRDALIPCKAWRRGPPVRAGRYGRGRPPRVQGVGVGRDMRADGGRLAPRVAFAPRLAERVAHHQTFTTPAWRPPSPAPVAARAR